MARGPRAFLPGACLAGDPAHAEVGRVGYAEAGDGLAWWVTDEYACEGVILHAMGMSMGAAGLHGPLHVRHVGPAWRFALCCEGFALVAFLLQPYVSDRSKSQTASPRAIVPLRLNAMPGRSP